MMQEHERSRASPSTISGRSELTRGKQCVQSRNGKRGWVRAPFSLLTYVNIDRARRS
jgi:hypothetical protein